MSEDDYMVTVEALDRLAKGWKPQGLLDADHLHPDYRRDVAARMAELMPELEAAGVPA